MQWTDEHKYALQIVHTEPDKIVLHEIVYEEGLEWLYKNANCEWIEHLNPHFYWAEYPAELIYGDLWIDEEGKLNGKLPTFPVYEQNGQLSDVICGNMIFTNGDNETGETHGMTHDEVLICANWAYSYLWLHTKFKLSNDIPDLKQIVIRG